MMAWNLQDGKIRVIMKNADKLLLLAHLFGNNGNIFTNLLYF